MEITTDIILILYGERDDMDRCIASIKEHCLNYKIHVIDNNEENKGFTRAVNEGIEAGTAPYVWLVNQDAIVLSGAQEALINRFSYHERVGIVGSMQIDPDNPDIIRHGGTIRAFPGGQHAGGLISMGHCRFPKKQTWVNFASVMFRRKMIDDIGLLDEKMFLLYSDSDYCYYARSKDWEVWYEPNSKVKHRLNASAGITEWHKKDMEAFMEKWGITVISENQFQVGPTFANLDKFP